MMARKKELTRDKIDARVKEMEERKIFIDKNEFVPLYVDNQLQDAWDYLNFCEEHKDC